MKKPDKHPAGRVVVVGGGGGVGALFSRALAPGAASVHIVDTAPAPVGTSSEDYLQGDVTDLGATAAAVLAAADVVVVALPEAAAEAAIPPILAAMAPDALLVDTLSVKTGICAVYAALRPSQQVLSINPMFAPSLGFAGHGAIVVPVSPGPRADWFGDFLAAAGCRVLTMTAGDHDRATAGLQVMTHAAILGLGLGLAQLGHDIARLAPVMPPPHRALLGLLARIAGAAPETYRDIQAANPYAAEARQALADGVHTLSSSVDDPAAFAGLVDRLKDFLGPARESLADEAAARLTPPNP